MDCSILELEGSSCCFLAPCLSRVWETVGGTGFSPRGIGQNTCTSTMWPWKHCRTEYALTEAEPRGEGPYLTPHIESVTEGGLECKPPLSLALFTTPGCRGP